MKKGRWPYLVAVAVLGLAGAVVALSSTASVASVGPGEIRRRIVAIGVEAPKKGIALIRARTAGVVRAVYATEGASVRPGQLLAVLEDAALTAELRRVEAARDSTAESLKALMQGARSDERAAADAEVAGARVQSEMAEDRAQRQAQLGPAAAEAAVAQARWEADLATSRLEAAKAHQNLVELGAPKPEVRAARFKLEEAQAAVDAAREALQRTRILAPIDGTVLTVRVHEGDSILGTGSDPALFEVASLNETEIRSEVDADDARLVQLGQRVKVLDGTTEVGIGAVSRMSEILERRTNGRSNSPELNVRNVWVDVSWKRGDQGRAPLGNKYEVEIELPPLRAPAVVPRSAIAVSEGLTTISVYDGVWPKRVRIEIGATDDRLAQVLNVPIGTRFRTK
jgi:multidrug efflux pump subunit AcrA (membrane-fusion protein)